ALAPKTGETVLVVGATGGVGSFFVQLAAAAGATVIASALPDDHEYLGALGVAEVVDRGGDVGAAVKERHPNGVEAVLDVVSPTRARDQTSSTASSVTTTPGSKCVPEQARNSSAASAGERALRYERSVVIALHASQMQTIRATSGMRSPARASG